MTDVDIKWVTPSRGRSGSVWRRDDLWLRVSSGQAPSQGHRTRQVTITIYTDMMRALRLVAGDRIRVGFTSDDDLAMRRVVSGGYMLTPAVSKRSERQAVLGSPKTSVLKFAHSTGYDGGEYTKDDILVLDDGTIIVPRKTPA